MGDGQRTTIITLDSGACPGAIGLHGASKLRRYTNKTLPLPLIPSFTPCSNSHPTTTRGEVGEGRLFDVLLFIVW